MTFRMFNLDSFCRSVNYACPLGGNSLGGNSQNYNSQKSSQKSVTQKSEINISGKPTSVSPNDVETYLDELLRGSEDERKDLEILLSIIENPDPPINRFQERNKSFPENLIKCLTEVLKDERVREVVNKRYFSLLQNQKTIRGNQFIESVELNNV